MELFFVLQKFSFGIYVLRYRPEIAGLAYFIVHISYGQRYATVNLHRERRGGFRFCIRLPFFRIQNDVIQKGIPTPYQEASESPWLKLVPVVTGKIFGFKFGGE